MTTTDLPAPSPFPSPSGPAAASGLDLIRQVQAGALDDVPSILSLLGMCFDEVEEGRVVVSLDTRPDFANPLGTVHGGIAATLLDSALGCAIHTTLPAGTSYTTLELKVNYIRAARTEGQRLTAEGTVIHTGRRTATAEGRVLDERGRLIAHATTTCLVMPVES
ncbi:MULTISPECIES: PaaI family thioesterase [unclassified Streptomyces]|uniref:PaaI family thioesterase n=1 Tax=unclassified Streptomyces TaxID=2593676 RepID=UPI003811A2FE